MCVLCIHICMGMHRVMSLQLVSCILSEFALQQGHQYRQSNNFCHFLDNTTDVQLCGYDLFFRFKYVNTQVHLIFIITQIHICIAMQIQIETLGLSERSFLSFVSRTILQMSVWQDWLFSLARVYPSSTVDKEISSLVMELFRILLYHAIRLEYGGWRVWIDTLSILHTRVGCEKHKRRYPRGVKYQRDENLALSLLKIQKLVKINVLLNY